MVPMSKESYNYSLGKFLETSFYNDSLISKDPDCGHSLHHDHVRCFGYGNTVINFLKERLLQ